MPRTRLTPEAVRALEKYFQARADEEARKPPNEYELRRAERAKQYWLRNGLVRRPGPREGAA